MLIFLILFSVSPHPLWQESIDLLHQNPKEAILKFENIIKESEAENIFSPEAHFNLGVAYWKEKNAELANYEILKSSEYRNSPLKAWTTLNTLAELQNELGITNSPVSNIRSKLSIITNSNLIILLLSIFFWGVCFYAFLKKKRNFSFFGCIILIISILSFIATGALLMNRKMTGSLMVLRGSHSIDVYKNPDGKENIIEFPAGTIVLVNKKENNYYKISSPVTGWVEDYSVIAN